MDLIAAEARDLDGAERFLRAGGGAPANVAVAAARLGARVAFVGALGHDPFGRALARRLEQERVDTSRLRWVPERTSLAFVASNRGGIPDFIFYRGADAALRADDIPIDIVTDTAFVYVSSMALLSEPSAGATRYAAEAARERGALVAVDPNLRPSSWPSAKRMRDAVAPLVRGAQVLKLNDVEARFLTDRVEPGAAARTLGDEDTLVVVTLGQDGCLWQWAGCQETVAAPEVHVADTTGAGDAFMGALLTELAQAGFTPTARTPLDLAAVREAVRFAAAAGAAACAHTGAMTALPDRAEVERLLTRG